MSGSSPATGRLEILVNGAPRDARTGDSVEAFLRAHDLEPDLVVVEMNGAILPRDRYAATALQGGDALEIVHFVGGG